MKDLHPASSQDNGLDDAQRPDRLGGETNIFFLLNLEGENTDQTGIVLWFGLDFQRIQGIH
jgi:hypothetical protein